MSSARAIYLELLAHGCDLSKIGAAKKLFEERPVEEVRRAARLIEEHRQDLEAILRARQSDLKAIREEGRV